jgi:hypothetical protein
MKRTNKDDYHHSKLAIMLIFKKEKYKKDNYFQEPM